MFLLFFYADRDARPPVQSICSRWYVADRRWWWFQIDGLGVSRKREAGVKRRIAPLVSSAQLSQLSSLNSKSVNRIHLLSHQISVPLQTRTVHYRAPAAPTEAIQLAHVAIQVTDKTLKTCRKVHTESMLEQILRAGT